MAYFVEDQAMSIVDWFWCLVLRLFMPKSHEWVCTGQHDWSTV